MHWALKRTCCHAYIRPRKPWTDLEITLLLNLSSTVVRIKVQWFNKSFLLFSLHLQIHIQLWHPNCFRRRSSLQVLDNGNSSFHLSFSSCLCHGVECDDLFDDESECLTLRGFRSLSLHVETLFIYHSCLSDSISFTNATLSLSTILDAFVQYANDILVSFDSLDWLLSTIFQDLALDARAHRWPKGNAHRHASLQFISSISLIPIHKRTRREEKKKVVSAWDDISIKDKHMSDFKITPLTDWCIQLHTFLLHPCFFSWDHRVLDRDVYV